MNIVFGKITTCFIYKKIYKTRQFLRRRSAWKKIVHGTNKFINFSGQFPDRSGIVGSNCFKVFNSCIVEP